MSIFILYLNVFSFAVLMYSPTKLRYQTLHAATVSSGWWGRQMSGGLATTSAVVQMSTYLLVSWKCKDKLFYLQSIGEICNSLFYGFRSWGLHITKLEIFYWYYFTFLFLLLSSSIWFATCLFKVHVVCRSWDKLWKAWCSCWWPLQMWKALHWRILSVQRWVSESWRLQQPWPLCRHWCLLLSETTVLLWSRLVWSYVW